MGEGRRKEVTAMIKDDVEEYEMTGSISHTDFLKVQDYWKKSFGECKKMGFSKFVKI